MLICACQQNLMTHQKYPQLAREIPEPIGLHPRGEEGTKAMYLVFLALACSSATWRGEWNRGINKEGLGSSLL